MSSDDNNGTLSKHNEPPTQRVEIIPSEPNDPPMKAFSFMTKHFDLLINFLSEVFATGLLIFLLCMGCVDGFGHTPSHLQITLGVGFAVMISLNIFGMVSGAHMNPAITLAAFIYKRVNFTSAIVYVLGQLLGGYLGYGLLRLLTPDHFFKNDQFCLSLPSPAISTTQAFFVEFIISAILVLFCCGVWDPRQARFHDSVALRFGMVVTVLALFGGPYSGGSMNPARSLAPALYNWNFESQWLYWAAPMSASIVATISFRLIFYKEPPQAVQAVNSHSQPIKHD